MVKKTKKNKIVIDGNTFVQEFDNIQFVIDYKKWKDHCSGISGSRMGVDEANIPTLFDFLENHIFNNVREGSQNAGADDGTNGAIEALSAIEDIMEDRVIYQSDIENIEKLYKRMGQMQDNKGPDGLALDPKLILFTEKQGRSTKKLYGHFATPSYIARKKKKDANFKGEAVPAGWYSGAGNPPSFALFSNSSHEFAEPKGLLYILDDALKELGDGPQGPTDLEIVIGRLKGKGAIDKLAGIASVERYFDKAINNDAFWQGGKLRTAKLAKDVATKSFDVSTKEVEALMSALNLPKDETPAGRIKSFKVELTGTPIILFIKAALERANKKKGGDEYRAWVSSGQFDYRKTAKEVYGEDTGRFRPDQKVISKSWTEILKQSFTSQDIDNIIDGIADTMEIITEKMFMDGYKSGFYDFDNFWVQIEERIFSRAEGPAFNYTFAYRKPPDYVPSGETLIFAEVLIAGTEDGKINDVFFNRSDSEQQIKNSFTFMRLPNIRSIMRRWARELSQFKRKIMGQ